MFAWSRTWYAERDGKYYNFDMKKQRDSICNTMDLGFRKVSASEAYNHFSDMVQVPWRTFDNFIKQIIR